MLDPDRRRNLIEHSNQTLNDYDKLVPLAEAADKLTWPQGRQPKTPTIWSWAHVGLLSGTVRLETVLLGGRRLTTPNLLLRFLERVAHEKMNRAEQRYPIEQAKARARAAAKRKAAARPIDRLAEQEL